MGTAMEMIAGGVLLVAAGAARGEFASVPNLHLSWVSVGGLAYLVLFGSLAAFTCYTWLLRNADVTLVSTYAYVNPVVAVILGTVLLGEAVTLRTVFAAAVILAGVALIVSRPATKTP
jgi:drug/metabolite transporter (DMT)-like permease